MCRSIEYISIIKITVRIFKIIEKYGDGERKD